MGLQPWQLFPQAAWQPAVLVCWDVWRPDYPAWERLFRGLRPVGVLMTAQASAQHFQRLLPDTPVEWLPEATDPEQYDPDQPLGARTLMLEIGRKHPTLHRAIDGVPESAGFRHLHAASPTDLLFADRQELADGLAKAAVSICLPSSVTHPERSGDVEVTTHRYFESMASGSVVWGHAPPDLIELFGYNPVVEIDWGAPASQLRSLLDDIESYQPLVDRNTEVLMQRATWDVRAAEILSRCDQFMSAGRETARRLEHT